MLRRALVMKFFRIKQFYSILLLFTAVGGKAWKPSATFARVSSNGESPSHNRPKISLSSPSTKIQTKVVYTPAYTNSISSGSRNHDIYSAYGGYYLGRMLSRPYGCYSSCGYFETYPYYHYVPYRERFEKSYPPTTVSPQQTRDEERESKIIEWRTRIGEIKKMLGASYLNIVRSSYSTMVRRYTPRTLCT